MISSSRFRNSGRNAPRTDVHHLPAHRRRRRAFGQGRPGYSLPRLRGQHDEGVAEVDRAPLAVGQPAVVQHLQQDVEDVRVRLLDLVEQDHLVGPAAHRLGQRAALLVADIARRGADQAGDACFSMNSLMSMRTIARSSSNRNAASALVSSVLPTPVGPEEQEAADRPVGVLQPGARAAHRVGDRLQRILLADHALAQLRPPCAAACRARPPASCRPGCRSSARPPPRCPPRSPPR